MSESLPTAFSLIKRGTWRWPRAEGERGGHPHLLSFRVLRGCFGFPIIFDDPVFPLGCCWIGSNSSGANRRLFDMESLFSAGNRPEIPGPHLSLINPVKLF